MLVIFGGTSRQARQMASEYGRAAQTLLRDGNTSAADAFGRLHDEGIKRLARATAVAEGLVSIGKKRWSFDVPANLAARLEGMCAQPRLHAVFALGVDAKGRRKLLLVALPSPSVGPKPLAVSAKPTHPTRVGPVRRPPAPLGVRAATSLGRPHPAATGAATAKPGRAPSLPGSGIHVRRPKAAD